MAGGGGGGGRIRDGQGLLLPSREQIDDGRAWMEARGRGDGGRARGREADGGRATARMDPPRWAADRGRRRRIHEGEGLLLPSRERMDDSGLRWRSATKSCFCYCCYDA